jgi:hypothetical protein
MELIFLALYIFTLLTNFLRRVKNLSAALHKELSNLAAGEMLQHTQNAKVKTVYGVIGMIRLLVGNLHLPSIELYFFFLLFN